MWWAIEFVENRWSSITQHIHSLKQREKKKSHWSCSSTPSHTGVFPTSLLLLPPPPQPSIDNHIHSKSLIVSAVHFDGVSQIMTRMSSFIAVEKNHFEPWLQGNNFKRSSQDVSPPGIDKVTISRSEYEYLLQTSCHFTKLKDSLLNGGLSQETLDILIYGSQPPPPKPYQQGDEHSTGSVDPNSPTQLNGSKTVDEYQEYSHHGEDDDEEEDGVIISQNSDEKDDCDDSSRSGGSYTASTGQRTILIRNLPDRVFHQDIVDAVRGGALLHIYVRSRERTANVSFVEETAAQDFLQHTKTYGLYLAGKRVEVSWSERQFYLPPYVRAKISNGASRNLVINNVNPNMTESHIRNDLEHIHNLIVISVKFQQGNAYISTNSVHNALFARSCMMSRFVYKGTRIGFFPDDCAEPLPQMPTVSKKDMLQIPPKKPVSALNRFQLLSLDGTEEEESDSYENIPDDLNGHPSLYGGICWADNSVYA